MSLFSLLQSQANRKRLDSAKGMTETRKKLDRAEKIGRSVGLYSTRDKKGSAGTKAGFGRRTGRSQSLGLALYQLSLGQYDQAAQTLLAALAAAGLRDAITKAQSE